MMLINDKMVQEAGFSENILADGLSIYEVIRIFRGRPIFLSDNLLRLTNSLQKSGLALKAEDLHLPQKLQRLVGNEGMREGNLKYVLHFHDGGKDEYIYRIPHSYPTEEDYRNGVPAATLQAMRENPEVKYINAGLRTLTDRLIREQQVHEILLVDRDGCITEGSRSNVFFVKGESLHTCPVEYVLPGTSRKRVFGLCSRLGIPVVEERIPAATVSGYEAAFITGTSPLILPLNRIDRISMRPDLPFLQELMKSYFAMLESSC